MKKLSAFIFILCLLYKQGAAVNDSLIFKIREEAGTLVERVGVSSVTNDGLVLAGHFYLLFHSGIDKSYVANNINDSAWHILGPGKSLRTANIPDYKNCGTFKLHYRFTKGTLGHPLFCVINQMGASAIYDDGKLIEEYGKPATTAAGEEALIPRFSPFFIVHNDTLEHVLTILYSNHGGYSTEIHSPGLQGFDLDFFLFKSIMFSFEMKNALRIIFTAMGMFFFALFVVHLFLFYADKSKRFNLFYSLFMLTLSLAFIRYTVVSYIESPALLYGIDRIGEYFIPGCCLFLLTLLYNIFQKKFNFFYYFMILLFVVFIITDFMKGGFNSILYACMFITTYFGVTVLSIKALRRKYPGARYLGWGILLFTICFIVGIIGTILLDNGVVLAVGMTLSVLSLPVSMTAYLSHDFAVTSRSLKLQLETNEELSKQTIRQEKEKQELLANQNKTLEEQVEARTHEIAEQNKTLEHQKKEITDSINYARRIQQALLPDLEEIAKHLPNSFVFYQPKDIVSGDFYFFHRTDEAIYIAAADCTGHGVPGALMSMIVHEKLSAAVEQFSRPSDILHSINMQVKDALKQHQGENASRDGCDIALCRITKDTLTYSGAFRPLYIFDRSNAFTEIKATKTAIAGLTPYDQQFGETELQLKDLKMIYMFSDGYADQFGGAKTKKLTTKKFRELLTTLTDEPVKIQHDRLQDFFAEWRAGVEQIDDVLVIGIVFS